MKSKKIMATVLGIALAFSAGALAACDNGGNGEDEQKDINFKVEQIPVLSFDTAEDSAINEVIATDELVVSFDSGNEVSAAVTSGSVTIAEGEATTSGSTVTQEYTLTATGAGDYTLTFTVGSETVQTLEYTVSLAYPEEPNLNEVNSGNFTSTNTDVWNIAKAHDPSFIEADGKFYAFSTDNSGTYGYQVRESDDLINWSWVGNAIPNCGDSNTAANLYARGEAELQEVYTLLSSHDRWAQNYVLWAPDVVEAADGGYWLYGSWTAAMYTGVGAIFLCYADEITGPYEYVDTLVYSPDNWSNGTPNAIDPNVTRTPEGELYLTYGSFNGGIWQLELDPETGLRADGNNGIEKQAADSGLTKEQRYGTQIISTNDMEGPTINYHENVAIYEGDPAEYSESAVQYVDRYYLMGSANSLAENYNMRSFYSESITGEYTSHVTEKTSEGNLGNRVAGSFTWQHGSGSREPLNYGFGAIGHNDMITTSDGRNIIAYHNRIGFGGGAHYLFTSSYAFTSRGDLVMNPNRYAGEAVRKIVEEEITAISEGSYSYAAVTNNSYRQSFNGGYAKDDMVLTADHKIQIGGQDAGTWIFYGDNYIYIDITVGELDGEYYGVVMPAYIEASRAGGLTISCLSGNGRNTLFLNANV